ncbi:hypothetical protein SAMN05421863_11462 [Nitrosomonas communis]|uniref:Uncharacterized protein n=1 Tax=Nitrosomonas communis TaxID=44574 RepID=A0A1I4XA63_9PROT|nr:hypothetical protein SAMN05421863_11462 [Nitrosomonas communis]
MRPRVGLRPKTVYSYAANFEYLNGKLFCVKEPLYFIESNQKVFLVISLKIYYSEYIAQVSEFKIE